MLDAIFGHQNFRNEIIWKRISTHSSAKRFGPVHDTIFLYTKTVNYTWDPVRQPYDQKYIDSNYRSKDDDGRRYTVGDLAGAGVRQGESAYRGAAMTPLLREGTGRYLGGSSETR